MRLVLWGDEQHFSFQGAYQHEIKLTIFPQKAAEAGHVVALAFYRDQLLFTKHKERGMEWPGGKVEPGETPLEAVTREIKEETGGLSESAWLIGQYQVMPGESESFIKNIYVVTISRLDDFHEDCDTLGPVLLTRDVKPLPQQGFSPLVCDGVFRCVQNIVLREDLGDK